MSKELNKILYVDDDEVIGEYVADYISSHSSIEVAYYGSVYQALNAINDFNPDLILLDYSMPEVDGVEGLKKIRKLDEYKYTPIIFITGKDFDENYLTGITGIVGYIKKPFKVSEVLEIIKDKWKNL